MCPAITFDSVDLPAPLAPSRPCTSPASSSNEAPASARVRSKVLQTPVAVSSGASSSGRRLDDMAVPGGTSRRGAGTRTLSRSAHLVGKDGLLHRRQQLL